MPGAMSGLNVPAIVTRIRHPLSIQDQVLALKSLKNDIIGNQERKDVWITSGVLEAVVKAATWEASDSVARQESQQDAVANLENARVHALAVLGSFASGGPRFVAVLYDEAAIPAILSNLCPDDSSPLLVSAALRVLSALAKSSLLSVDPYPTNLLTLADALFSDGPLRSICKILHQSFRNANVDAHISYTASLVGTLCCQDRHRDSLVSAGVLNALADVLAVVVVSQGLAIPRPGLHDNIEELLRQFPVAQPAKVDIGAVFNALASIISDSKSRAYSLICSPALQSIWQHSPSTPAWASSPHQPIRSHNTIDLLNPQIPCTKASIGSPSSAFPPLGSQDAHSQFLDAHSRTATSGARRSDYQELSSECSTPKSAHESESPLISYLIWMTRSSSGTIGLMSAHLLAAIYKAGLAGQHRDVDIAMLVVPLIVLWLDEGACEIRSDCEHRKPTKIQVAAALAPGILAKFLLDSERLQKAAYDAGAIPKLCKILQSSYQPITPEFRVQSWSPRPANADSGIDRSTDAEHDFPPLLVQKIQVRECALRAIAALLPFKDDYRKSLVGQGVMAIIVESLRPKPGQQQGGNGGGSHEGSQPTKPSTPATIPLLGINTVPILVAACAIVRHLSRSPAILRTTLVDSGVAMPLFDLLHYPDVEVQIAATAAVCNIVTDMSPMRQTISEAGVQKVLCEHAHSKNINMRYNALWALKHFIMAGGIETKKSCLRELGQDWLLRLIGGDLEDEMYESNNTATSSVYRDCDVAMGSTGDEDEGQLRSYPRFQHSHKEAGESRFGRRASMQLPNGNPVPQRLPSDKIEARKDETRIQEQCLDILRNLIGGPSNNSEPSDTEKMVTYLFDCIGEEHFFELLASKLRSKVHHPFSRGYNGLDDGDMRVSPPRPEILTSAIGVLVNVAGSKDPRHRHAILKQTELMKLVLQHANHPAKEVRLAFCWLLINLIYIEDEQDRDGQAERVRELHKLGAPARLDPLVKDVDLDVRERAKTARFELRLGANA